MINARSMLDVFNGFSVSLKFLNWEKDICEQYTAAISAALHVVLYITNGVN